MMNKPKSRMQKFLLSPTINRIGLFLAENLKPKAAKWIIRLITNKLTHNRNNEQIRAVRSNQWMASGKKLSGAALDEQVERVYLSSARSIYDYFRCMRKEDQIRKMIHFDDNVVGLIERTIAGKESTLGLLIHMGAYDLGGYAMALRGAFPFVLAYPNPNPGYQWHNELRRKAGIPVESLTMESFHKAVSHLRKGGTVLTGIDRPWKDGKLKPRFFGEPSDIPVTTIQMAIRTNTPVMLLACIRQPEGHYIVHGSQKIEVQKMKDRNQELLENTEKVLAVAETFIRSIPEQWSMFYPVWPEISI